MVDTPRPKKNRSRGGRYKQNLSIHRGESVNDTELRVWLNCPQLLRINQSCRLIPLVINKKTSYTPDFLLPNGLLIEVKGFPTSEWMEKMKLMKVQSPSNFARLRVLFSHDKLRVPTAKKQLATAWAENLGLIYACGDTIPKEWLEITF